MIRGLVTGNFLTAYFDISDIYDINLHYTLYTDTVYSIHYTLIQYTLYLQHHTHSEFNVGAPKM